MNFGFQKNPKKIRKSLLFVSAAKKSVKRPRKHTFPQLEPAPAAGSAGKPTNMRTLPADS
jgi:hypothetical protein